MSRTIILHYHLFKNAGTSIDRILRRNFAERWVTREFDGGPPGEVSKAVSAWIEATPEAVAFASHTACGPIPKLPDVNVISIMLLRDPIARIRSAYLFERQQDADTWGAVLAKAHDFAGYVQARLARTADRQCRNFQTSRLASIVPGPQPELDRAKAAMRQLTVLGRVEAFDAAMARLGDTLAPYHPGCDWTTERANVSDAGDMDMRLPKDLTRELVAANKDDLALIEIV